MSEKSAEMAGSVLDSVTCEACDSGLKCAVMSWAMPLLTVVVLFAGLRYQVLKVFVMLPVAMGGMALLRSLLHLRQYRGCGLGVHAIAGVTLHVLALGLAGIYLFTSLDPVHIRP